jgi:hypothetical protein
MLKAYERQIEKQMEDEDNLIVAESHLDYTARRLYNIKVSRAMLAARPFSRSRHVAGAAAAAPKKHN